MVCIIVAGIWLMYIKIRIRISVVEWCWWIIYNWDWMESTGTSLAHWGDNAGCDRIIKHHEKLRKGLNQFLDVHFLSLLPSVLMCKTHFPASPEQPWCNPRSLDLCTHESHDEYGNSYENGHWATPKATEDTIYIQSPLRQRSASVTTSKKTYVQEHIMLVK